MNDKSERINWHSASYSAIKIELSADADELGFHTEYPVNKAPRRIDMLVVKRNPSATLQNPIARNFRRYNLIEYKGPAKSLSITSLTKTISYALSFCEEPYEGSRVRLDDITLTLITHRYPAKMFELLRKHNFNIEKYNNGIYNIKNMFLQVQVVVTRQLDAADHIWLRSLGRSAMTREEAKLLMNAYWPHQNEPEYSNYMNIIIQANRTEKEGGTPMCSAILEIIEPKLKESWDDGYRQGSERGQAQGEAQGEAQGLTMGYAQGHIQGFALAKRILCMNREGKSPEEIAAACGITEEKVRELLYD